MTNDELESGLIRVANAVERLAEATQQQMGIMSEVVLEVREETRSLNQAVRDLKQRQAETDQRFNVLLDEFRYLIRRLPPHNGSEG